MYVTVQKQWSKWVSVIFHDIFKKIDRKENDFLNKTIWKHLPMLLIIFKGNYTQLIHCAIPFNTVKCDKCITYKCALTLQFKISNEIFSYVFGWINWHLINTFSYFITFRHTLNRIILTLNPAGTKTVVIQQWISVSQELIIGFSNLMQSNTVTRLM